jgi:hypothetical protein
MLVRSAVATILLLFGSASAQAVELDVYILTGQSNSLGTTNLESPSDPGVHPADSDTDFFWANAAGGSSSNVAYPAALSSSSGGLITALQVQGGEGGNPTFWGPEFGFARRLYDVGERDFLVVKASKGGGPNTFWDKSVFDANNNSGHMWGHLRDTVDSALSTVIGNGDSFNVKGFMYLQGESNTSSGAAMAGSMLGDLINNLQTHINSQHPSAADDMFSVIGEIAASTSNANRTLTTQQQMQLASNNNAIEFVPTRDLPLKSDGIHFGRNSKLTIGQRFADVFNLQSGGPGSSILAGYRADLGSPGPIPSPVTQGMQAVGSIVPGVTLEPVDDAGVRAWRVSNNSRSAIPGYVQNVGGAHFQRMFDDGWSLKATAKVVSGGGQALWSLSQSNDPGWGMTDALNTNGFVLDRVNGDELQVMLWGDPNPINLGPGSADDYHTFELLGAAGSSLFDFYIDDVLRSAGNDLRDGNGLNGFEERLAFNSGLGTGRDAYWNEVLLSVVPIPEPTSSCLLTIVGIGLFGLRKQGGHPLSALL